MIIRWLINLVFAASFCIKFSGGQCVDESPIPPTVSLTTWTPWYNVDDPSDGTDDETYAAVKTVHPAVCPSPSLAECRVRFLHTDHVTAGQTLVTSCLPTGGLLCRNTDQTNGEDCLDYEIRFECPSPADTLPEPRYYWDLSTKASPTSEDPSTCEGTVTSIYANAGGMTGSVGGVLFVDDSYDSCDHLCTVRNYNSGWVNYGSANDRCISDPACCTAGFTITFWMRNTSPRTQNINKYIFNTGGHTKSARGITLHIAHSYFFWVREGASDSQYWNMAMHDAADFPDDQWTHYCFTFEPSLGIEYYRNGTFAYSKYTKVSDSTKTKDYDDVIMFNRNPTDTPHLYRPLGYYSDFKIFYRYFNAAEVQTAYRKETTESKLVIHYLRKHSHADSLGVELECLAKAGSRPTINWYRSDDGAYFSVVSPSSPDVAIYESSPNSYRRRSILISRHHTFSSDTIFACEAVEANGGRVSKMLTIPKHNTYWTPWLSADTPTDGDDIETLTKHQQEYNILCKYPIDVQCRTVYGSVPSNETGQMLNINCTISGGIVCRGNDQSSAHAYSCYDYKVRYLCAEPRYRWTPWYDTNDPDGSMEDETLDTHKTRSYPDLCDVTPVGAECRVRGSNQDLISSGIVPEIPYLCNAKGFRCQYADNTVPCPDFEVRYQCPDLIGSELSLQIQSHHLDPDLRLKCSATVGMPKYGKFALKWAWLDDTYPSAANPITSGGPITVTSDAESSSTMVVTNFGSSNLSNKTLVCIAQDGIIVDARTIKITLPSVCEQPLGVATGGIDVTQITPSTIKSAPFKVPGINRLDPWVPDSDDPAPSLDFDLGVNFMITGVAIQGEPLSKTPTYLVTEFSLYTKETKLGQWAIYTDKQGNMKFATDYKEGKASFSSFSPNITSRFLRVVPTVWTPGEIMMRIELYGCEIGESTLQILNLTKTFDFATESFNLTCLAEHYPLPILTWLADNVPVSTQEDVLEIVNSAGPFPTSISVLRLINFHPDNNSVIFTCQARAGNEIQTSNISTEYDTSFEITQTKQSRLPPDGALTFECQARGFPAPTIEWEFYDSVSNMKISPEPATSMEMFNVNASKCITKSTLVIHANVVGSFSAVVCVARISGQELRKSLDIIQPTFHGNVTVSTIGDVIPGGTLRLLCHVTGDKVYTVDWYLRETIKDSTSTDELLESTEGAKYNATKIVISPTIVEIYLDIKSFTDQDYGIYVCSVNRGLAIGTVQLDKDLKQTTANPATTLNIIQTNHDTTSYLTSVEPTRPTPSTYQQDKDSTIDTRKSESWTVSTSEVNQMRSTDMSAKTSGNLVTQKISNLETPWSFAYQHTAQTSIRVTSDSTTEGSAELMTASTTDSEKNYVVQATDGLKTPEVEVTMSGDKGDKQDQSTIIQKSTLTWLVPFGVGMALLGIPAVIVFYIICKKKDNSIHGLDMLMATAKAPFPKTKANKSYHGAKPRAPLRMTPVPSPRTTPVPTPTQAGIQMIEVHKFNKPSESSELTEVI